MFESRLLPEVAAEMCVTSIENVQDINDPFVAALESLDEKTLQGMHIVKRSGTFLFCILPDYMDADVVMTGSMFLTLDAFGKKLQHVVEEKYKGILVKTLPGLFVCFFDDHACPKPKCIMDRLPSHEKAKYASNCIQCYAQEVEDLRLNILLTVGSAYRRTLHLQKKTLVDYHGRTIDYGLNVARKLFIEASQSSAKDKYSEICETAGTWMSANAPN